VYFIAIKLAQREKKSTMIKRAGLEGGRKNGMGSGQLLTNQVPAAQREGRGPSLATGL
jgi:hypothetical protein